MGDNEMLPINHEDAYSLACMRSQRSNLARCYIELHDRPTEGPATVSVEGLVAALEHIKGLADRADGTVGFVDNPHEKALRVASELAAAALSPPTEGK